MTTSILVESFNLLPLYEALFFRLYLIKLKIRHTEAIMNNQEIVQKLWNLCNVLRDDGITYQQYVTELTYLLFLKMMQEKGEKKRKRLFQQTIAGINLLKKKERN